MKRFVMTFAVLVALVGFVAPAFAQQAAGAYVTQTGTKADAATAIASTVTTGTTLTLTPAAGESIYVFSVHVSNCAGASAVTAAGVTSITTTNLGSGTTPAWTIGSGVAAGLCTQVFSDTYPTGLKANGPGLAVTFVTPTYATNQSIRLQVAYRSAP